MIGLMAGVLGQLMLLGLAVLLSRDSGPWLLFWAGVTELIGLIGWVAARGVVQGSFATSFRLAWAITAIPVIIGLFILAWFFQLARVL